MMQTPAKLCSAFVISAGTAFETAFTPELRPVLKLSESLAKAPQLALCAAAASTPAIL